MVAAQLPLAVANAALQQRGAEMTIAQQVDALACRHIKLQGIAGEMFATIKLNVERGYLVATNDEGKLNLSRLVDGWEKQLKEFAE